MRLIDANALMEYCNNMKGKTIDANDIARFPTAVGWISVKDRLPEKQTPVLVYVPPYSDENEEYIGYVGVSYYTCSARGGYWAGTDGNVYGAIWIIHDPTYWAPLPEPPNTEK